VKINRILVSQPVPVVAEKSPYNDIHTLFGVEVDYRPLIRVEGVSLKEFRSQRTEILDHTAVIFTSRTTIDHFFRIADQARVTIPETMKYICNTEATALYLQKYIVYRKRKIFFADGSFKSLMELIMKHKDERYLLVLSEPHKPEIPATLEKLKLKFSKVILSRTVSAEMDDLDMAKYDMVVLFSPSEITALVAAFGTENLPLIATFGDGTTRTAIECGLRVNVMAPTPEAPSMAKAIELFIKKIRAGEVIEPVSLADNRQADEFVKIHAPRSAKKRPSAKKPAAKSAAAKSSPARPVAVKK
jgi:uroporphyrinogen-III synthase